MSKARKRPRVTKIQGLQVTFIKFLQYALCETIELCPRLPEVAEKIRPNVASHYSARHRKVLALPKYHPQLLEAKRRVRVNLVLSSLEPTPACTFDTSF